MQKGKWVLAAAWVALAGCGTPRQQPKPQVTPKNMGGPQAAIGLHFPKVVLIGDSVLYTMAASVQNPLWINAATNGPETTGSMLARFQADVVDQHPDVVVILGGTYDTLDPEWHDGGSSNPDTDTSANVSSMADMANAAGIKLVVATVPLQGAGPMTGVSDLNGEIIDYDYYVLVQEATDPAAPDNPMKEATLVDFEGISQDYMWTTDGINPNAYGDTEMAAAVQVAVVKCECGGVR